jgi:hypothetical protein
LKHTAGGKFNVGLALEYGYLIAGSASFEGTAKIKLGANLDWSSSSGPRGPQPSLNKGASLKVQTTTTYETSSSPATSGVFSDMFLVPALNIQISVTGHVSFCDAEGQFSGDLPTADYCSDSNHKCKAAMVKKNSWSVEEHKANAIVFAADYDIRVRIIPDLRNTRESLRLALQKSGRTDCPGADTIGWGMISGTSSDDMDTACDKMRVLQAAEDGWLEILHLNVKLRRESFEVSTGADVKDESWTTTAAYKQLQLGIFERLMGTPTKVRTRVHVLTMLCCDAQVKQLAPYARTLTHQMHAHSSAHMRARTLIISS